MIFHCNSCGIFCAMLTYFFIFYADYVIVKWLVLPTFLESFWGTLHIFVYNCIIFLAIFSHLRAMLTDPGIVPISIETKYKIKAKLVSKIYNSSDDDDYTDSDDGVLVSKPQFVGENWTICNRCESFRPPRSHHCRICRRCIRKMDHHCPWVNNCVGEFNQKYFLQFVFYIAVLSTYSIIIVIISWVLHDNYNITGEFNGDEKNYYHLKVVHSVALTIESILFGLFVLAISCDQLQAIFNDETVVEAFQRRGGYKKRVYRSKYALLREVCGPDHWILWVLPCNSIPSKRDIILFAKDIRKLDV